MLNLSNISLRFGAKLLFSNLNLSIFAKQKVGVIGANGSGKSSLFKLLLNELSPDSGDISLPKQVIIGHVAQLMPDCATPAIDYVIAGDTELQALWQQLNQAEQNQEHYQAAILHNQLNDLDAYSAPTRAAKLLEGLGFTAEQHQQPVNTFSGGWRMRLNLARALMRRCDLLLLDEPTNHLDLDAILWLEKWLKSYTGVLLLISHDREFLDGTVTYILHFEQSQLKLYTGNYSTFEQQRAVLLANQQAVYAKQQREITHMQNFIARFKAKASKAKQAQSRVKALARMELIAAVQTLTPFNFSFVEPAKNPSLLLKLEQANLGYASEIILHQVNLRIDAGMRLGLLGPNGAGKSTLIKSLAGRLPVMQGQREPNKDLKIGYYAQHQLEQLIAEQSPLQHLQAIAPETSPQELRNFLGSFAFSNDMAVNPITHFSGGEKARLALALIIWQRPNLLLLDEPTNHLDLEVRNALILALQQYTGAVILVSHDRYLLRTTTDQFLLVANQQLSLFNGDISDYETWLYQYRQQQKPSLPKTNATPRAQLLSQRALVKQLTQKIQQLEKTINSYHTELQTIEQTLANAAIYSIEHQAKLQAYLNQQALVRQQLADTEVQWLDLQIQLEAL